MARKPRIPKKKGRLSTNIERLIEEKPQLDFLDTEVESYLDAFAADFSKLAPMPKLDLTSQEAAIKSLAIINGVQKELDEKLKTARALKTLLNQQPQDQDDPTRKVM
jgi:hypothetical protein